jgi:hypothetical protein
MNGDGLLDFVYDTCTNQSCTGTTIPAEQRQWDLWLGHDLGNTDRHFAL